MGVRTAYANGAFNWVDLVTTDPTAAKTFYSEIFSWEFEDISVGETSIYSMALKNGQYVSAITQMNPAQVAQSLPPHWQSYIHVTDLAVTVETWTTQGGTVLVPPFPLLESGLMAIAQDPTGATVNLWQPINHRGAGLVNEANTFCWNELQTRGVNKAANFYKSVFNWEMATEEKPPFYTTAAINGHFNCGMFDLDQNNLPLEIPCHWEVYFNVASLDDSLEQAKVLGATAFMEPMLLDVGRFVTIADPLGAVLTLIQLDNPDD